jgi:signal transduction histidine kinase
MAPLDAPGFSTQEIAGQELRVYVLATDDGTMRLEVAELQSARLASLDSEFAVLAVPPLLSLMALVGLSAWLVRRATRGLRDSARQVTQRSPSDLRPLVVASPPQELTPIIASVNSLFSRIESALEAERRFTSAAAHELRTPLATIRTQAQVALLTAVDSERRQALERLVTSIDRAARMIEQLLTMSRIDGLIALRAKAVPLQLDSLVAHVIDEEREVLDRREQIMVEELTAADLEGLEFCIAVLVRNLIDNAARYGPPGGTIRVRTGTRGGHCFVSVEDEGPGIAPEERGRVFERFSRLRTSPSEDGCGIGLSIVQAVVEMHRGRIDLDRSELGGLIVTVRFPTVGASMTLRPDDIGIGVVDSPS